MNPKAKQAGFSLLEVLCAMLILGVALVGLTQGITTALGSSKDSELQTTAVMIAAGQIETLRAGGDYEDGVTEGTCDGLPLYQWKQTISDTKINGLHDVEVEVQDTKSGKAIYNLRTQLFDPGDSTLVDQSTNKPGSSDSKKRSGRKS